MPSENSRAIECRCVKVYYKYDIIKNLTEYNVTRAAYKFRLLFVYIII